MARATGIGGVFLRARDPEALGAWYARHLGVPFEGGFARFKWNEDPTPEGSTIWSPFERESEYFGSVEQQVMINYRVDDLDALVAQLEAAGVEVAPERAADATGKFAWAVDPEGNRIELWQPPNA